MTEFSPAERALLMRLAELFGRFDPVPAGVTAAARDAALVLRPTPSWRRLAAVRDCAGSPRRLSFGVGPRSIDLEVAPRPGNMVRIGGRLARPACGATKVWVRWPGGAGCGVVDRRGRFTLAELPAGPLCLAVPRAGDELDLTPWFVG